MTASQIRQLLAPGQNPINKLKKGMIFMKKARKLITFILTVVMVLSMSMNVWAVGAGTITITNAKAKNSYSIYRILNLESYVKDRAYAYTVVPKWENFITTGAGTEYLIVTDGYVTWKGDKTPDRVAEFAEAALAYARANNIAPENSKVADSNTVTFDNLELGYYLVDSSTGILCSLDTTDKDVEIEEKNEVPEIQKTVTGENSADVEENTATIGDDVDFKVEITAKKGAKGYVLHDKMENGLTFKPESISVKLKVGDAASTDVDAANYAIKVADALDEGEEYETPNCNDCDFEIVFNDDYLATLDGGEKIIINYSATLNSDAVVGATGNKNIADLEYGETPWVDTDGDGIPNHEDSDANGNGQPDEEEGYEPEIPDKPTTTDEITITRTFSFDLVKTDSDDKLLDGATFKLYTDEGCTNALKFSKDGAGTTYTVDATNGSEEILVTGGNVVIEGLAKGTYYLKETDAPQGYNLLIGKTDVIIVDRNLDATMDGTDPTLYVEGGVQVENNTGSELPSTGGIGTTIFYIVGGALVLFAVVLLVTKKRMKDNQ